MKKLREYKGVAYNPEIGRWLYDRMTYLSAASLIAEDPHFTDDDHAELMRLKAEPYEPESKVTLEDVVAQFWSLFEHQMGFRLRGSIEAEATRDLCKLIRVHLLVERLRFNEPEDAIRTAFPHIDQEQA
jgi:hypothetical protein